MHVLLIKFCFVKIAKKVFVIAREVDKFVWKQNKDLERQLKTYVGVKVFTGWKV